LSVAQAVGFADADVGGTGAHQPGCPPGDGFQHAIEVPGRRRDHPQDFGSGGLLLQRLIPFIP